jgi:hypothetical protein
MVARNQTRDKPLGQRRCGSPAVISSRNIRLQTPQAKGTKLKTISAPNEKTGKVI